VGLVGAPGTDLALVRAAVAATVGTGR
jgi:hypothetical protein